VAHSVVAGDPSLRLKNGYAQDDGIDERRCHQKFKMSHYPREVSPKAAPGKAFGGSRRPPGVAGKPPKPIPLAQYVHGIAHSALRRGQPAIDKPRVINNLTQAWFVVSKLQIPL